MADSLATKLVKRYERLREARRNWDAVWQELADYIVPRRGIIVVKRSPGTKHTEKLFDSTAIKANYDLAAFIAATLTSPVVRWFSLRTANLQFMEDQEVREWLDQCANLMYAYFQNSNFNSEVLEAYIDIGAFGTAALLVEERTKAGRFAGFRFRTEPIGTYVIQENADGLVDTLFRLFPMTVRAAADKWGEDKLSERSRKLLEAGKVDEYIEIMHAIYPRDGSKGVTSRKLPWASVYIERVSERNGHKLEESGFHEFPYMVPRWSKTSGEEYGRGPGHIALPDIKTLNKADELTLRAWQKAIDPPVIALHDGVVGRISFIPSAINVVTDPNALQAFDSKAKFEVNIQLQEQKRASVRSIFFADQLQLPDKTIITATEVERRLELMQQVLGPTMGRLEHEFLTPLIDRCFGILLRAGVLPPLPATLEAARAEGAVDIDVEYEGPLARAQRSGDLNAIQRTYQALAPIVEMKGDPAILDNLDEDEIARHVAKVTGLPARLLRAPDVRDEIRTARTQAMQEQAQMAKEQQVAETVNTMGEAEQKLAALPGSQQL